MDRLDWSFLFEMEAKGRFFYCSLLSDISNKPISNGLFFVNPLKILLSVHEWIYLVISCDPLIFIQSTNSNNNKFNLFATKYVTENPTKLKWRVNFSDKTECVNLIWNSLVLWAMQTNSMNHIRYVIARH